MDLSFNDFRGQPPASWRVMTMATEMYLSNNKIESPLNGVFNAMEGLLVLDLSHNKLTTDTGVRSQDGQMVRVCECL